MTAAAVLLFRTPIEKRATELFNILDYFEWDTNILYQIWVGIGTDGAWAISGIVAKILIQALQRQKSPLCILTYYMGYRECLASKRVGPELLLTWEGGPKKKVKYKQNVYYTTKQ